MILLTNYELFKKGLKKIPLLSSIVKYVRKNVRRNIKSISSRIDQFYHRYEIDLIEKLSIYSPYSAGSYKELFVLTIDSAKKTFPYINQLLSTLEIDKPYTDLTAENFCTNLMETNIEETLLLKELFIKYGSDKSSQHNYHLVYGPILKNKESFAAILEIGMGTNNIGLVSNMGKAGKPGASLRAFRDFLPIANIYGADIDRQILFEEDRIKTFYVDQTNLESLDNLASSINEELDLIIDDGLHSPHANIAVLSFALKKIKLNGWVVIEDISEQSLPVWQVVAATLPKKNYNSYIIYSKNAIVFSVKKNA